MIDYYILKKDVNQDILKQYGYKRYSEDQHYIKEIILDDQYIRIAVHRLTGRINFGGHYYMINEKKCIKDLIEAGLVDAVEFDYNSMEDDPDEFEDDTNIGLGEEMLR